MSHRARRRFGQNFLVDRTVIDRIVRAIAPRPGDRFMEIGPGHGALTVPLLEAGAEITAIELDRDLAASLAERLGGEDRFRCVQADALDADFTALADGTAFRLVGNLPYNISTPVLFHVLSQRLPQDMHVMLQREVVERICAAPGSRTYGRLSVMIQNACAPETLLDVPPECFEPAPRVHSAVLRLVPRTRPLARAPSSVLDRVVRAAFSQRRKTLRNSLSHLLDADTIAAAGIDPGARAETLTTEEFDALALAADGNRETV